MPAARPTAIVAATDADLVRGSLDGSERAFRDLVCRYERPVRGLITRLIGDPSRAEELAQDTFMKAFQHLHTYDEGRKFSTWLLSIAHHAAIDELRRKQIRTEPLDETLPRQGQIRDTRPDTPASLAERGELRAMIAAAIRRLRPEYAELVTLRYEQELTLEEVGRSRGCLRERSRARCTGRAPSWRSCSARRVGGCEDDGNKRRPVPSDGALNSALEVLDRPDAGEREVDAAFATIASGLSLPAPSTVFVRRVIDAVRDAPLAEGRRALGDPAPLWGRVAALAAGAAVALSLLALFFGPLWGYTLARFVGLIVRAEVSVLVSLSAAVRIARTAVVVSEAVASALASPPLSGVLLGTAVVGGLSLLALIRLLSREQESLSWPGPSSLV